MLLTRTFTGLILFAVMMTALFTLSSNFFAGLIGLIVLVAAWEWSSLADMQKIRTRVFFLMLLLLPALIIQFWPQFLELMAFVFQWQKIKEFSGALEWLVVLPTLFWIITMFLIRKVPDQLISVNLKKRYKALFGWFVLFFAWMFLTRLRTLYGTEMILYFLLLIWSADIAAYFVGRKFGKIKLAEQISPGKTIEGMYGALIMALICGVILGLYYGFPLMIATDFILLSILTVLVSIYGDLFISLFKRQKGVKDSGVILPGHGGVLDRIDSMIAAAPFFYAGVLLIGRSVFS